MSSRIALVTGAQRGLGLEACRSLGKLGYTVVLSGIVLGEGRTAARSLSKLGYEVEFCPLDITNGDDIKEAKRFIQKRFGRLDVLINNAAVFIDEGKSIQDLPVRIFEKVINVNTFGALRMCQAFFPLMIKQDYGRIVNVSSGKGQLSGEDMTDDTPAYCMSKAALNAATVMFADAAAGRNILVNSVCPGWCRTDIGGSHAPRSAKKGAETIVWLATLPDDGPTGGFFRDKEPIDW